MKIISTIIKFKSNLVRDGGVVYILQFTYIRFYASSTGNYFFRHNSCPRKSVHSRTTTFLQSSSSGNKQRCSYIFLNYRKSVLLGMTTFLQSLLTIGVKYHCTVQATNEIIETYQSQCTLSVFVHMKRIFF